MTSPSVNDFAVPGADINSLVTGDMSQPEYRVDQSTNSRYANRGVDANGNCAVLINAGGDAGGPGGGFYQTSFTAPAGVPSVTLSVIVSSYTTTTSAKLAFYDSGLNTIIASQRVTITTTPQLFELPLTVTADTVYGVGIVVNDIGQQARLLIWAFVVRPTPSQFGLFSGDFVRIRNSAALMGRTSIEPAYFQNWAPQHSRMADVGNFVTDATRIAGECYCNESIFFSQDPVRLGYMVNDRPRAFSPVFPVGLGIRETELPYLPGEGRVRSLRVRTRATGLVGGGTWNRAIYLPLNGGIRFVPRQSARCMVVVCDSIGTSFALDPHWQCWIAQLREKFPGDVLVHGAPGQQLHDFAGDIAGAARTVGRMKPTCVWFALTTNDYAFGLWSAAAFGAALTTYVDTFHACCPDADFVLQTPLHRTSPASETAFVAPQTNTLADFAAQMVSIGNDPSRAGWCHVVLGTGAGFPQVPAVDGIHPDTDQHGQILTRGVLPPLVSIGVI